eukprot:TRINITY_DN929_c0_g1_i4.p1 TRINITY_DN929_c0_g1~~TRINITY_DN929_c0_g1_i4.p1  ORF type:complete len:521 (+),score=88.96 TRINITY_DN929_c0_g1_i4:221-1783(+)
MNNFNSASLYVGNLSSDISESSLYEIFSQVGLISSIRVCRDALTRRSLGYAYVNYHNPLDASEALERFNNNSIMGKPCRIMYSQRDPSLRKSGIGNIFIKNLNKSIDHKSLFDTFSTFGNILSCKIALDDQGKSKGYGFVQFETQEMADRAIENVNGMMLMDKQVFVGKYIPRKERIKTQESPDYNNIYVKNLPETFDEASFIELFKVFGQITSNIIISHDNGKYGFVNYERSEDARKAVEEMNGKTIDGRVLYVGRAQTKAERQAELRQKTQADYTAPLTAVNLYIKNINDDVTEARLKAEFGAFGPITSAEVMKDDRGNSRGFGFICFANHDDATRAVQEMNLKIWDNKPIYVAFAQKKEARRAELEAIRLKSATAHSPHFHGGPLPYPSAGQPPMYFPNSVHQQPYMYPPPQMFQPPSRNRWNNSPQRQFQVPPQFMRPINQRPSRGHQFQQRYPNARGGHMNRFNNYNHSNNNYYQNNNRNVYPGAQPPPPPPPPARLEPDVEEVLVLDYSRVRIS